MLDLLLAVAVSILCCGHKFLVSINIIRTFEFLGANLKNAVLDGSQMTGINLRIANLKGACLLNCVLHDAILAGADLEVRNFCRCRIQRLH